ncbi:unnamed protein product [Caenorhabditis angaria]|uniref:Replication protein A C-terminal domain-containing protein n=1 Tax=Caenorhabditis angaria TaxID=860376 RepID=A0A9P1MW70_9PELO|nr:unnamed protein product [Caenorhabditis angaria]
MAEWDQSFQGEQKWQGENSFATGAKQDSRATAIAERLPVPTTITDLNALLDTSDDKFVLGTFRFATVMTVGLVKSISDQDGTMTYTLGDPDNDENDFVAVKYASDSSRSQAEIVEGSRVRAIGKLKGFDGNNIIMLFNISEIPDDKDYRIFTLEAKAAKLFFEKNVMNKLKSGNVQSMKGMLAPPTRRNNSNTSTENSNSQPQQTKDRIYQDVKPAENSSLENKIMEVFKTIHDSEEEGGVSVDWITSQCPGHTREQVKQAIEHQAEMGNLYETHTAEYYAKI